MRKMAFAGATALAILGSATIAVAQSGGAGGGAGGAGGGTGGTATGVSPNSPAPGAAGPMGTQTSGGRSVSTGGANAVDTMRTAPPGATNQK